MMDLAVIRLHMIEKGYNVNPGDATVVRWAVKQAAKRIERKRKR